MTHSWHVAGRDPRLTKHQTSLENALSTAPFNDAEAPYNPWLGLQKKSHFFVNDEIGIRAFVFNDPEGYQIEIQSATREGA